MSNGNDDIVKAIASNPNTPLELLIKLAKDYPNQFLKNPALDLYLLEDINLLAQMPESTFTSLLTTKQIPESFILFALNNRQTPQILKSILIFHTDLWNQWRQNNPTTSISLKGVDLQGVNLKNTNLQSVNLRGVKINNKTKIYYKWLT